MATLTATGINTSNGTLDGFYTGSTTTTTSYPLGSYLFLSDQSSVAYGINVTATVRNSGGDSFRNDTGTVCAGTWKSRGRDTNTYNYFNLMQRIA